MKLGPFLATLATVQAGYRREISNQCDGEHVGQEASLVLDQEMSVEMVKLGIDGSKKNDYFGLEVLMHHPTYKRPMRCGTKISKKTLKSVSNQLQFKCKGKGKQAAQHLKANKIQLYIKKKVKRGTRRCLDFSRVELSTIEEEKQPADPVQSTEKTNSGSTCVSLKNEKEKSGLFKNGEWNKGEGRQFNSFIHLPFPVKAVTNWSVSVTFTNVVSDVEVWNAVAQQIDGGGGKQWRFVANENTPILWNGFYSFNFLGSTPAENTEAKVSFCYDTYDPSQPEQNKPPPSSKAPKTTKTPKTKPSRAPKTTRAPKTRPSKAPKTTRAPKVKPTKLPKTPKPPKIPKTPSSQASKGTKALDCSGPSGHPATGRESAVRFKRSSTEELKKTKYDLNEVLHKSILFYEAQRSGHLPSTNRIGWRGDSALHDGCDVKVDLTGGWYDAGDHVKFGLPMAFSTTLLAWGIIDYSSAYKNAEEYTNAIDQIKWTLDYFVKCHPEPQKFYFQVGNGETDHASWGRPEEMNMNRPALAITPSKPGSDVVAETAAALAAGAMVIRGADPYRAAVYTRHAEQLFDFANKYRGKYSDSFPDETEDFYKSWGYKDELAWAAAWLYRSIGSSKWEAEAKKQYDESGSQWTGATFSWDDKKPGTIALMAKITGETKYSAALATYVDKAMRTKKTPKGLAFFSKWGSTRYAANAGFIAAQAALLKPALPKSGAYFAFAQKQLNYLLGDTGRSFVVGFGRNPPTEPHHRGASCDPYPARCDWAQSGAGRPSHFKLYGALVGGPDLNDKYNDKRNDYIANEVATDYNAGFQSLVAAVKCKFLGSKCLGGAAVTKPSKSQSTHQKQPQSVQKPIVSQIASTTSKPPTAGNYQYNGDITVYAPKPDGGNCGFPKFSPMTQKYFVALPKAQYDNSMNCGRCIKAHCTAGNVGTNCDSGETTIMMVTDSCPECHIGDLDLSYAAWDKITGGAGHSRFKAEWSYVDCPDEFLMHPTLQFYIKPGSSRWWFAVMPLSSKVQIDDVQIKKHGKWQSMATGKIDSYYYLAEGLDAQFDVKFIANGKEIIHHINNPKGGQTIDTKKQF